MQADLVISFKVFRERFGSRVRLFPQDGVIDTAYLDGPFKHMVSRWTVQDAEGWRLRCRISMSISNSNRPCCKKIIGVVFDQAMRRVVGAFEARARALYG